jgi:thiol peroxidase
MDMATITLKGQSIHTMGDLPAVNSVAKDFVLVKGDLSELTLKSLLGKKKLLNIFPSLDTGVCATSVRSFAKQAKDHPGLAIVNISKDLPFAQGRFCTAEGIQGVETGSVFRSTFAQDYGLEISDGPLKGLCSRAVIVLDENNRVLYVEQVPEIVQEPNYQRAFEALRAASVKG